MAPPRKHERTTAPEDVDRGNRIASCLKLKGWDQAELSRRMGMSATSVNKLVHGTTVPRQTTVERLCKLFGVSHIWLMYGSGGREQTGEKTAPRVPARGPKTHPGLASWLSGTREGRAVTPAEREWLRGCPWPEEIERAPDESYLSALEAYRSMMRADS